MSNSNKVKKQVENMSNGGESSPDKKRFGDKQLESDRSSNQVGTGKEQRTEKRSDFLSPLKDTSNGGESDHKKQRIFDERKKPDDE